MVGSAHALPTSATVPSTALIETPPTRGNSSSGAPGEAAQGGHEDDQVDALGPR
jgi:hypothetical protein